MQDDASGVPPAPEPPSPAEPPDADLESAALPPTEVAPLAPDAAPPAAPAAWDAYSALAAPDTYAPGTYAPGTYAPGTYAPGTYAPGTYAPGTYAPGMGMGLMKWNGEPLPPDFQEKKVLAGILGIVVGSFGIHKFILGYNTEGLIMVLVTVLTLGFGGIVMGIIGLIEGIIYLTKSDQDFVMTYGVNKKGWF